MIKKFQITIQFEMSEELMKQVPKHRQVISKLIQDKIIDYYSVSLETCRSWLIMNATSKKEIITYLKQTPLFTFWTIEIDELFVYDGQTYRLPEFQLN